MRALVKLLLSAEWDAFDAAGAFGGSPDDVRDGFIHLSTLQQADATRTRHFAGVMGIVELTLDADALAPELRWEVSRDGALFPHLYRALRRVDIMAMRQL